MVYFLIGFGFGFLVGVVVFALAMNEKSKTHNLIFDGGMKWEERPDNAKPGVQLGTMFYCPSCELLTCDVWITNPEIGDKVKCPSCQKTFTVSSNPDVDNMVSVES